MIIFRHKELDDEMKFLSEWVDQYNMQEIKLQMLEKLKSSKRFLLSN